MNWKTSTAGTAAIATAIATLLTAFGSGHLDPTTIGQGVVGLITGIGFLYAKDHNVTGGDTKQ